MQHSHNQRQTTPPLMRIAPPEPVLLFEVGDLATKTAGWQYGKSL